MGQLNFSDIFNKSFVGMTGGAENFTTIDVLFNLLISFAVGMFIFFIYKKTFQGVLYQKSFNITLVIICMVTSMIIMTISGNLILSLGMVGALSIVRFRTPVKDPVDLAFLFWTITVGIANGVGYYNISILGSIAISMVLLFMTRSEEVDNPFLLVLELADDAREADIKKEIMSAVKKIALKSKSVNPTFTELTYEVKLKGDETSFIRGLKNNNKISKATLVSYSGDLTVV